MKRKILIALLVFGLHAFGALAAVEPKRVLTGLVKDQLYMYWYSDSNGNGQSGPS